MHEALLCLSFTVFTVRVDNGAVHGFYTLCSFGLQQFVLHWFARFEGGGRSEFRSKDISVRLFVNIKSKPSSDTLVEPIERYHLHQIYNPRQQIGKRLLNPLPFLAGVATPSFTKQCEDMKSAAKHFGWQVAHTPLKHTGFAQNFR